ncbi:hypothetical protein [Dyadobacter psychrotolerans]|uniref:Fibronectin type III domain-containing protein n=1 Tax=Dyadobacter psychrotolerans TaxID=2541721 RepID=A0A4R5DKT7_9BACT|nr:hypothetical protein [Dyadobacter psychrotolerans]TDE14812.1 hypothetical protein E0F88_16650 [Dyadobacter psychrotolerans]
MKCFIPTILTAIFTVGFFSACEETLDPIPPTLSNISITAVGVNTANFSSAISKSGNQEILDHGFTVSLSDGAPVIDDKSIKRGAIDMATPTPIAITGALSNLQTATEYYLHAFVMLKSGPIFSEGAKFKTSNVQQPGIRTDGFDAVTYNSAQIRGSITAKGSYPVSEYGIVWSGTDNPTTESSSKYTLKSDVGNVPAFFSTEARGLSPNTTYHYRAYVISNGVTSYGADVSFRTSDEAQPKVQTGDAKVGTRVASLFAQITALGSSPITQYGICWSTLPNPTVASNKFVYNDAVNQVPKSYFGEALNLAPSTTYYYRAFVTMNGVTTYGDSRTFRTAIERQPTVVTGDANPRDYSAVLSGSVTAAGDAAVSQYGICWSLTANPTTSNSKLLFNGNITSFPKNFQVNATNLSDETSYNYRAYVIMNGVTTYGANRTFRTPKHIN